MRRLLIHTSRPHKISDLGTKKRPLEFCPPVVAIAMSEAGKVLITPLQIRLLWVAIDILRQSPVHLTRKTNLAVFPMPASEILHHASSLSLHKCFKRSVHVFLSGFSTVVLSGLSSSTPRRPSLSGMQICGSTQFRT